MSASFRMQWVYARGRWSIQGENKVYVFRRTFLFFSTGCCGGDKLSFSPWSCSEVRTRHEPSSCSPAVMAWTGSVSPILCSQGPSAQLPFCDAVRTDGIPLLDTVATLLLLPGLMPELGCLGLEWVWTWAVFQVCVSSLCYGFRLLILPIDLDGQKVEIIAYVDRELGTMWVYKQKQTVLRLKLKCCCCSNAYGKGL